jgi:dienelactone hydrolase
LVEVLGLQFASVGENGQEGNRVTVRYYKSRLPGPKPLLVVLPIWGSSTYPPRKMVRHVLRRSGGEMNVVWIQGTQRVIDWEALVSAPDERAFLELWREMGARERATIVDVLRVLDWGARQPETDARRIGLMGFSHGAMVAAFIATQDPRLTATVLVMGGAHPYEALAGCPGGWTEKIRQTAKSRFGWSGQDYESRLAAIYGVFDPANYPGRVDPRRILIVDAAYDSCVPQSAREALWKSLGYPERVTFAYGHKSSFLSMTPLGFNWTRRKIWSFLDQTLVERPLSWEDAQGQARGGRGAAGSAPACPGAAPN